MAMMGICFAFVFLMIIVVGFHEMGHALAAHFLGVGVRKLSLGFGPVIFRWQFKSGFLCLWSLWPLGGYVSLLNSRTDSVAEAEYPHCFDKQVLWRRLFILLAGVLANLIMAFFLMVIILSMGSTAYRPVIKTVMPGSMAATLNLTAGDEIKSIGSLQTHSWQDFIMFLILASGEPKLELRVNALDGQEKTLELNPSIFFKEHQHHGFLMNWGIQPDLSAQNLAAIQPLPLASAIVQGWHQTQNLLLLNAMLLKKIGSGELFFSDLIGPIESMRAMIFSLQQGLSVYLFFLVQLSIAVAVVNILPFPGLDGGLMLYALFEQILRRPMSIALEILLYRLFFIAFCLVLMQLLVNDINQYR